MYKLWLAELSRNQYKAGFIKRLNDTFDAYPGFGKDGFEMLRETLDRRNLLDVAKHHPKK